MATKYEIESWQTDPDAAYTEAERKIANAVSRGGVNDTEAVQGNSKALAQKASDHDHGEG